MISLRAPRMCREDRRAHCATGKASKAGSAVVNARATWGRRWRAPWRASAWAITVDRAGAAAADAQIGGSTGIGL